MVVVVVVVVVVTLLLLVGRCSPFALKGFLQLLNGFTESNVLPLQSINSFRACCWPALFVRFSVKLGVSARPRRDFKETVSTLCFAKPAKRFLPFTDLSDQWTKRDRLKAGLARAADKDP